MSSLCKRVVNSPFQNSEQEQKQQDQSINFHKFRHSFTTYFPGSYNQTLHMIWKSYEYNRITNRIITWKSYSAFFSLFNEPLSRMIPLWYSVSTANIPVTFWLRWNITSELLPWNKNSIYIIYVQINYTDNNAITVKLKIISKIQ